MQATDKTNTNTHTHTHANQDIKPKTKRDGSNFTLHQQFAVGYLILDKAVEVMTAPNSESYKYMFFFGAIYMCVCVANQFITPFRNFGCFGVFFHTYIHTYNDKTFTHLLQHINLTKLFVAGHQFINLIKVLSIFHGIKL